jgi:hypothetical protein
MLSVKGEVLRVRRVQHATWVTDCLGSMGYTVDPTCLSCPAAQGPQPSAGARRADCREVMPVGATGRPFGVPSLGRSKKGTPWLRNSYKACRLVDASQRYPSLTSTRAFRHATRPVMSVTHVSEVYRRADPAMWYVLGRGLRIGVQLEDRCSGVGAPPLGKRPNPEHRTQNVEPLKNPLAHREAHPHDDRPTHRSASLTRACGVIAGRVGYVLCDSHAINTPLRHSLVVVNGALQNVPIAACRVASSRPVWQW